MKKLIPLIAIVLAMALPVVASADAVSYYDYTTSTRMLEMVEDAIQGGRITFDTEVHKTAFLAGIQQLYNYRDAENWSACVTIADNLASTALQVIPDDGASSNVSAICSTVGDIYGTENDAMDNCSMSKEDEQTLDDNLGDLCGWHVEPYIRFGHEDDCTWWIEIGIRIWKD